MTIDVAKKFVQTQIDTLEMANLGKELRPWVREACPAASRWWGLTQQRIALSHPNPQRVAACDSLNLAPTERTAAQILAAEAAGRRLAMARAV